MNNIFNRETLAILSPDLFSLALSVVIGLYAWRRRKVAGAAEFALYTWAAALISLGFIVELLNETLHGKIFWDNFQYIGMLASPVIFYKFVLSYSGKHPAHPRLFWLAIILMPVFFLVLIYTDPLHGLFRPDAELVSGAPFSALRYTFTPLFWSLIIFIYALMFIGIIYLVRMLTRPHQIYRRQVATILIGILILLSTSILPALGVLNVFQRDITPLGLLVCNLIMAWGLFRYRLLDVVPVAYHTIVHSDPEAVIILELHERIVDMNSA